MAKPLRVLKTSRPGKLSRAGVKKAVAAVHVYPGVRDRHWEVREMGLAALRRSFASKASAVAFATDLATKKGKKKHPAVLVHPRRAQLKVGPPEKASVYRLVFDKR